MGADRNVLGLKMSFPPYLRSAMVWFPLCDEYRSRDLTPKNANIPSNKQGAGIID